MGLAVTARSGLMAPAPSGSTSGMQARRTLTKCRSSQRSRISGLGNARVASGLPGMRPLRAEDVDLVTVAAECVDVRSRRTGANSHVARARAARAGAPPSSPTSPLFHWARFPIACSAKGTRMRSADTAYAHGASGPGNKANVLRCDLRLRYTFNWGVMP